MNGRTFSPNPLQRGKIHHQSSKGVATIAIWTYSVSVLLFVLSRLCTVDGKLKSKNHLITNFNILLLLSYRCLCLPTPPAVTAFSISYLIREISYLRREIYYLIRENTVSLNSIRRQGTLIVSTDLSTVHAVQTKARQALLSLR